jgi:hypothetical protein
MDIDFKFEGQEDFDRNMKKMNSELQTKASHTMSGHAARWYRDRMQAVLPVKTGVLAASPTAKKVPKKYSSNIAEHEVGVPIGKGESRAGAYAHVIEFGRSRGPLGPMKGNRLWTITFEQGVNQMLQEMAKAGKKWMRKWL